MADHDTPVWFITGCSARFGRELDRLRASVDASRGTRLGACRPEHRAAV